MFPGALGFGRGGSSAGTRCRRGVGPLSHGRGGLDPGASRVPFGWGEKQAQYTIEGKSAANAACRMMVRFEAEARWRVEKALTLI